MMNLSRILFTLLLLSSCGLIACSAKKAATVEPTPTPTATPTPILDSNAKTDPAAKAGDLASKDPSDPEVKTGETSNDTPPAKKEDQKTEQKAATKVDQKTEKKADQKAVEKETHKTSPSVNQTAIQKDEPPVAAFEGALPNNLLCIEDIQKENGTVIMDASELVLTIDLAHSTLNAKTEGTLGGQNYGDVICASKTLTKGPYVIRSKDKTGQYTDEVSITIKGLIPAFDATGKTVGAPASAKIRFNKEGQPTVYRRYYLNCFKK